MQRNNKPARIIKGTVKQSTLKEASGIWTLDEAMQAHRANAWPQPNLFQPVANSLRFKNNTSYVTRQIAKSGNQRTFTASLWVKRDTIGTRDGLFNTNNSGGNSYWGFEFGSDDCLYVYDSFSSTLTTTQVFRDIGAWYHIVVAVDTLQPTSSNRTKIYVNGTQVTSFSSAGYPAQGLATRMNGTDVPNQAIGCWIPADGPYHFGGYITEVNVIDGYQLPPTLFGKLDTNNTWVPIPYTGSYGTNGFYLPFTNTTTSQTLGYDASLNGTPTYDVDQDPYRGSVSLHLTGNGPAGGQNNTFADSSSNSLAITRTGNTTQGSFSPFPMQANTLYNPAVNGASVYFDGSGDYLNTTSSGLDLTNTDFTIEAWVNMDFANSGQTLINFQPHSTIGLSLNRTGSGDTQVYIGNGSSWVGSPAINSNSASTNLKANTWNHVALVRSGSTITLYHNGVSAGTTSTMPSGFNGGAYIGSIWTGGAGEYFKGYMSSFRVVRAAIYTAAFTPTNRPLGTLTNNLITFSEDFTNSGWGKETTTITSSAAIAPDGTPSASLVTFTSNIGNYAQVYWAQTLTATVTYTFSVWLSGAPGTTVTILIFDGPSVDTLQVTLTSTFTRYSVTHVTAAVPTSGTANIQSRAGDTATYCYAWGAQFETGSTATTYTPTPANFRTAPALLLNFANAAVVDSASATNISTVGAATITSSSKYGSGALAVSSNNYFTCPSASGNTNFGTGDFTVEFWWRSNGSQSNYASIISQGFTGSPPTGAWGLKVTGNSQNLQFTYNSSLINVGQNINSGINPNDSAWHHITVVRSYSKLYMFIDGNLVGNASIPSTETVGNTSSDIRIGYNERDSSYANGTIDDLRVTKGVARYQDNFTPPARALPEVGGDSFVTTNVNAGVVRRFTLDNLNIVGAKIYHTTTAARSANYTVQYSDDNSTWTTAFSGVMSSMDGTVGIKVGTVTSGGSGTTGTGAWGAHLYWRYVEGSTVSGHHPRCSRIIFTDSLGRDFNFKVFVADNSSDQGEYIIGTQTGIAQGPTLITSWTAPTDVTSIEVLVVAGGGGGGDSAGSGNGGGGGGAGGLIYNNSYPVTPGQTYTVTVGAGGSGGVAGTTASAIGSNSVFGNLIAFGGGRGGSSVGGAGSGSGTGGSGGGSLGNNAFSGTGTAGQGFPGAAGNSGFSGGGGGGAGAAGTGSATSSGSGGSGLRFGIDGTATFYAGGGAGGAYTGAGGLGSVGSAGAGGGGAAGAVPSNNGTFGTPNTGGGGGGGTSPQGTNRSGGNGGSGIVLIRYTTTANISDATTDNLVDSPTLYGHDSQLGGEVVGNYATLNSLNVDSTYVNLYDGNLTYLDTTAAGSYQGAVTNIFANSGKWYAEFTIGAAIGGGNNAAVGIASPPKTLNFYPEQTVTGYAGYTYGPSGNKQNNDTYTSYGDAYTTGDVISVAVDIDNLKVWFAKNGVWQASGDPAGGGNPAYTIQSGLPYGFACNNGASGSQVYIYCNFGQRPWVYKAPAGFNALTTKNLPRPPNAAAITPNQFFDAVTYTGTGAAQTITMPGGFTPDFVWIKRRNSTNSHLLADIVRGNTKVLLSNDTGAELTDASYTTFVSGGFSVSGNGNEINNSSAPYIAWCWRAGGAPVSNTAGTITSQVSANTASGFSIVTYTGNGTAGATIGHGLGKAPSVIFPKVRSRSGDNWHGYHSALGGTQGILLNSLNAASTDAGFWNNTAPTSSVITLGTYNTFSGQTYVAYCWAEVEGFSKFGSYTGNSSANGPFVYTGFKPRWIMVKESAGTNAASSSWQIFDTARDTYNPCDFRLQANGSGTEGTAAPSFDIVSNGFKLRSSNSNWNETGGTYIYMAFADKPFGNVNGTAR